MPKLLDGARELPLRHLSIGVPWNNTGWAGTACKRPTDNLSCLTLPRIRESRDDSAEQQLAGTPWDAVPQAKLPPCMSEHGGFMAPYELQRAIRHPYAESSRALRHFRPTLLRYPAYSAACVPYRWMLRESVD